MLCDKGILPRSNGHRDAKCHLTSPVPLSGGTSDGRLSATNDVVYQKMPIKIF